MATTTDPLRKEERLQFRVSAQWKRSIERWAAETGKSVSELVVQAVNEKQAREARERWLVTVQAQDTQVFTEFLMAKDNQLPVEPWRGAREAAARIRG